MEPSQQQKKSDEEPATEPVKGREGGDDHSTGALIVVVYDELRRLAAYQLSHENPGQMLESAALVDEAYLRLMRHPEVHWQNKRQFFVAAGEAMRRILIEDARRKRCKKRGGGWRRMDMDVAEIGVNDPSDEIMMVHEVLDQLDEVSPESAALVKLRFFAGFSLHQCADILGISKRTADNRWAFARDWLRRAVGEDG